MPTASEAQIEALDLDSKYLETYGLAHRHDPPLSNVEIADRLGVTPPTVRCRLALIERKLEDPDAMRKTDTGPPSLAQSKPKVYAKALAKLSDPQRNIAETARKLGINPGTASKIAQELDRELQPLKREIEEVKVEDLTRRFGTLTRDALDAITQEKLDGAHARDLGVIAGIGAQNFQLMRGQPTSRMEISDRREMNEIVKMMLEEAKRRGIEIDVTPDGGTVAQKSPYRNAKHQRAVKAIESGDPAEALSG